MKCSECETKTATVGSLCKGCHAVAHCIRCKLNPKALKSLCTMCYDVWEEIRGNLWDSFLNSA